MDRQADRVGALRQLNQLDARSDFLKTESPKFGLKIRDFL